MIISRQNYLSLAFFVIISAASHLIITVESFGKGGGCSHPGDPWQGSIVDLDQNHGGTVTFTCNPEYKLAGDSSRTCKHGIWSGEQPRCVVTYDTAIDGKWDFTGPDSLVKDDDWWLMTDKTGDEQREKADVITFGR